MFFLFFFACTTNKPTQKPIQLVESFPSETALDHADIPDAAPLWKELFDKAQTSIDLASFYISPSPEQDALDPVWESLHNAALRGVKLRILIDTKFSDKYPEPLEELHTWPNTTLKKSDFGEGVMHAKYMIIDNKEAFLGSQNFDYRALEHIYELGFHIRDSSLVAPLSAVFSLDWGETNKPVSNPLPQGITFVASPDSKLPPNIPHDLPHILKLIESAQKSLKLQFLSYNNKSHEEEKWTILDDALIAASKRGVRVELMVSSWSTKGSKGASLEKLREHGVLVSVITIPLHSSGEIPFARTIHAKYITADASNCWLGTSNASKDYFFTSRNVGLLLEKQAECARLSDIFSDIQKTQP